MVVSPAVDRFLKIEDRIVSAYTKRGKWLPMISLVFAYTQ
jgi:hypothetical protein